MTTATQRSEHVERVLLILILLVAVVARFRYLLQIEHNIDHAYPVWQAMTTLNQGAFPLTGQMTSVLFANPALTGYLFMPVVALTRSPLGVYIFVIALNSLAVWMAYRAALSLLGSRPALIAAGLMAVNPWVIEYSRTSWVQSLLPFFVCGVAWLLWPVLVGRSRRPARRILLALGMATMLAQSYLLGFFIAAPVFVLCLIFWRRLPRRALVAGSGIFVAAGLIFAATALADRDVVQHRLDQFTGESAGLSLEAWQHAVRLVSGTHYEIARGMDVPTGDAELRQDLSRVAHLIVTAALLAGTAIAVLAVWRRRDSRCDAALIALIWFWLPVIAMSYTTNQIHPTYQLLSLPAGYVLAAWGLSAVFRIETSRWGARVVMIAAVPFAALMLTNSARYYQETAAIPGAHDLGALPVEIGLQLGDAINAHLPRDGVVYADMPDWIANSFAGYLFPVVRDLRAPAFSIIPANGGLAISMEPGTDWLPFTAHVVERLDLVDGSRITIAALPAAATTDLPGTHLDIPTEQGLRLLTSVLDDSGDLWTLTTTWRVESIGSEVPARIFAPFVHIFDTQGERVLIVDGEGLPGTAWRVGDIHVHTMRFTPPLEAQGPFTLKIGQYDGIHAANIIFTPPDAPADAIVTIPQMDGTSP